jgi:hypothetical protein
LDDFFILLVRIATVLGNHATDFFSILNFLILIFNQRKTFLKLEDSFFVVMLEDEVVDEGKHFGLIVKVHDGFGDFGFEHSDDKMDGLVIVRRFVVVFEAGFVVVKLFEHIPLAPSRIRKVFVFE